MDQINFIFLGNYDITDLKSKINLLTELDWMKYTKRQEVFEAHKETICVPVLFDLMYDNKIGDKTCFYDLFKKNINSLNDYINNKKNKKGHIIRFEIVKMPAQTKIPPHQDKTPSLIEHSRIHIPIKTSDNVFFKINNEEKNLKEGEVWEINNIDVHSVRNDSDIDRIHLIMDWKETASKLL